MIGMSWVLILALARWAGMLEPIELRVHDIVVNARSSLARTDPPVTVVIADENDIARLGWPLSDQILGDVLSRLAATGPRAIGIDLYRDKSRPPGEREFAKLLAQDPRIIAVARLSERREPGISAPPVLVGTDRVALADMVVDKDGTVRRGVLYFGDESGTFPGLALRLALEYLAGEGIVPAPSAADSAHMRLGKTVIPPLAGNEGGYDRFDSAGYQFLLDFRDRPGRFATYNFSDVVDGRVPAAAVQGKVVIVGVNALSVKDFFYTPLDKLGADLSVTPGSTVHAQVVSQLIRMAHGDAGVARCLPKPFEYGLMLVFGLAGSLIGMMARNLRPFMLAGTAMVLALVGAGFGAARADWWLPLAPTLLAFAGAALLMSAHLSLKEKREREIYRQSLMAYLSPAVVKQIVSGNLKPQLGGERRDVTVMFADIRGYTTLSESMAPEQTISFLNQYFGHIVEDIHRHDGTVVSFMGDGIMAVFGAPIDVPNPPQSAFDAGKAMLRSVAAMNLGRAATGLEPIRIGIGLNHGNAVVGHVGAVNRHEYSAIGDVINVASRLEGLTKDAGFALVCSSSVRDRLSGEDRLEALGAKPIKGHTPVEVFGFSPLA
jgi:adenylate cyclase